MMQFNPRNVAVILGLCSLGKTFCVPNLFRAPSRKLVGSSAAWGAPIRRGTQADDDPLSNSAAATISAAINGLTAPIVGRAPIILVYDLD